MDFIDAFRSLKKGLDAAMTQMYASEKLGVTQVRFLRHLGQHPGISQAELARATDTDPALTGRTLQPLMERGLVRREPSPADRRGYVLELGDAGRETLERVESLRERVLTQFVAPLDGRDLKDFDRIAKKLLAALEAYSNPPASS
ncbi:MAG TPA: MarR family transcriptional regulator [Oscillatoriaceae cyanobacterium]